MKIWTNEYVFDHPWETVTKAVWRKYPNPFKPEVEATDVIDRKIDESGNLHTKRLISTRWGLPGWSKKLLGTEKIFYAFEDSKVDPINCKMTMETHNVTMSSTVSLKEKMDYSPDPEDPNKTIMRQQTIITVQGVPLTSYIENYLFNSVSLNSFKGREAMEWIIGKINIEVDELVSTCKLGTSEIITSLEEITDTAKKSIGGISNVAIKETMKSLDEFQNLTKPTPSLPRI